MKPLLLLILLAFVTSICYSQNNLQFNQVLTYTGQIVNLDSTQAWVVPSNKVWKIESMSNLRNNCSASFLLNGVAIKKNTDLDDYFSPIWLKAGDLIKFKVACSSALNYYLSIVEFNLIP